MIGHPIREETGMRMLKIVASGVVTFFMVAVIFIVSSIVQSPNKTNGLGVFTFAISSHGFLITAGLASGVVMLWVSRRKVRNSAPQSGWPAELVRGC
jgi:hypothetical protein